MSGVAMVGAAVGFPAIRVLRLGNDRPLAGAADGNGAEVVLAAVAHPPRVGEVRPIAALLPDVLARYGIGEAGGGSESKIEGSVDLWA